MVSSTRERYIPFMELYAPFYCEENIWQLCGAAVPESYAVFMAGNAGHIPFQAQRLGAPGEPVFWDYHVILLANHAGWRVYDRDSRLPFPAPLAEYLEATFREAAVPDLAPRFRLIPAEVYRDTFFSDRSHMRDAVGGWYAPPPSWPAIRPERGCSIRELADMSRPEPGCIFDLVGLKRFFRIA